MNNTMYVYNEPEKTKCTEIYVKYIKDLLKEGDKLEKIQHEDQQCQFVISSSERKKHLEKVGKSE